MAKQITYLKYVHAKLMQATAIYASSVDDFAVLVVWL